MFLSATETKFLKHFHKYLALDQKDERAKPSSPFVSSRADGRPLFLVQSTALLSTRVNNWELFIRTCQ